MAGLFPLIIIRNSAFYKLEIISTYLLLVVKTPAPPVEALRSHPVRLVGRQCASKRVVYLLGPPTVLPETNFCAMADLNMATDVPGTGFGLVTELIPVLCHTCSI